MEENINTGDMPEDEAEQNVSDVLRIRRQKLDELIEAGKSPYLITKYDIDAYSADIKAEFEKYENQTVALAGRIVSRRDMGKANFIDLLDTKGRIQCYIRVNDVGERLGIKKWVSRYNR